MKKAKGLLSLFFAVIIALSVFSISANAVATKLIGGSGMDTATLIPSYEKDFAGSINVAGEKSWYKLTTISENAYYTVKVTNNSLDAVYNGTHIGMGLEIYDENQKLITGFGYKYSNNYLNIGNTVSKTIYLEPNTTYYFEFYSHSKNTTGIFEFNINYTIDYVGDTFETSTTYKLGEICMQRLAGYQDVDFYKFNTENIKATYIFTLNNISLPAEAFSDNFLHMEVYDKYKNIIVGLGWKYDSGTFLIPGKKSVHKAELDPNEIYYVKIYTGPKNHSKGEYSFSIVANILETPKVTLSNVASSGKVKLTWNAVDGAKEYKIYRATSKSGTYKLMKTTTSTSYTNTSAVAGTTYYYKVKAVAADGTASKYSAVVTRTCDLAKPVVTTTNVSSSGKIKLTWDKVDGATSYKVYRATSKSGEYKLMKTTSSTSYTNTSATAGKTYYYKVKAVCSNSAADSAYSSIITRTCDLAKPTNVQFYFNSSNKPVVKWSKVDGATSYKVYRATSQNGTYKLMKTTTSTSYTNTSFTHGTTYYYKVKAVCSNSAADSAYSAVVGGYIK